MTPNTNSFDRNGHGLSPGGEYLINVLHVNKIKGVGAKSQHVARPIRKPKSQKNPVVYLPAQITVKDLAAALDGKLYKVIALLKQMNVFTSAAQKISFYTAAKIAKRYGYAAKKKGL